MVHTSLGKSNRKGISLVGIMQKFPDDATAEAWFVKLRWPNGIKSLWSMLKRAHKGTFHELSKKHLDWYVQEFAARHNLQDADTIDIMESLVTGAVGKRLRYEDLIANNGLASGVQS